MITLQGKHINLRALEPDDLDFLFQSENDESLWEVSSTVQPFSKYILIKYLENSHQDIFEAKQLRLIIENVRQKPVGMIDLFDFNPKHKRVGVGIFILREHEGKGYASEALKLISNYVFTFLNVHQIFANITADNKKSLKLFEKNNFKRVGVKKDWIFSKSNFKDEVLLQLINPYNA